MQRRDDHVLSVHSLKRVTWFPSCVVVIAMLGACGSRPVNGAEPRGRSEPHGKAQRIIALKPARGVVDWAAPGDYDGDRQADFGVKRDTGGFVWDASGTGFESGLWEHTKGAYGGPETQPVPADYDGDEKTDRSIYAHSSCSGGRDTGCWCITFSTGGYLCYPMYDGTGSAKPVPADYDGDHKADLATFERTGAWRIDLSSTGFGGSPDVQVVLPTGPSAVPAPADYDGDGRADLAIKDSNGRWSIDYAEPAPSVALVRGNGVVPERPLAFGAWDDVFTERGGADAHPVPADYDGDHRADLSVKSDGGEWHIDNSSDGFGPWNRSLFHYGGPEFEPVPADYDGDGRADLAVRWDYGDWYVDFAANDFGHWDNLGGLWNQDRVIIGAGNVVSRQDLRVFDAKWMNDFEVQSWLDMARGTFGKNADGIYASGYGARHIASWGFSARMSAMVTMYELTENSDYLAHLAQLVDIVLQGRDDRRADRASLVDPFRGRVMPAWGEDTVATAWNRDADVLMAGLYEYPMAAFARIVLESRKRSVLDAYGAQAREVASAVLETYDAFTNPPPGFQSELVTKALPGGKQESYWVRPARNGQLLTKGACQAAAVNKQKLEAHGRTLEDPRLVKEPLHCERDGKLGGVPLAHNQYHALMMAWIELARALATERYQSELSETDRVRARQIATRDLPRVIARTYRYFARNMREGCATLPGSSLPSCAIWNYADYDGSDVVGLLVERKVSDVSHANLDVRYLALLARDRARLNALLGPEESIDLTSEVERRVTNTFLVRLSKGAHLADDLADTTPPLYIDYRDAECDGWVSFARIDPRCFEACAVPVLGWYLPASAEVAKAKEMANLPALELQPHLLVLNHAALLAAKRYRAADAGAVP